jgi:hypothetical protein
MAAYNERLRGELLRFINRVIDKSDLMKLVEGEPIYQELVADNQRLRREFIRFIHRAEAGTVNEGDITRARNAADAPPPQPGTQERVLDIYKKHNSGWSWSNLASYYGISKTRVKQLYRDGEQATKFIEVQKMQRKF